MIPEDSLTISVFQDGNMFCAVFTDSFVNTQESDCGFGDSRIAAIVDLFNED